MNFKLWQRIYANRMNEPINGEIEKYKSNKQL